ncbi:Type III restriction endonuclease [Spraguea lophii 42_110]|uniref:Type III restriction endonuclease n=1 Tax=Spraguea lophii (strain 42_110) TaxID=1358809 RepID=S7XKV0_SPRLO|nr:Type III restriction endonuclease [Spraguea lophii 42_110]
MYCMKCPSQTNIKCLDCITEGDNTGKYYCNSISCTNTLSASHILSHLIACSHKQIMVNDVKVECVQCKNNNVFALTIQTGNDKRKKKQHSGSVKTESHASINYNENFYLCTSCIKPTKFNTKKSHPIKYIVSNKQLLLFDTLVTRLRYNYGSYCRIYSELIDREMEAEKKKKEDQKICAPSIRFNIKTDNADHKKGKEHNRGNTSISNIIFLKVNLDRYKVNIGDEVEIYKYSGKKKKSICKGIIAGLNLAEEELKIKVQHLDVLYEYYTKNPIDTLVEFNFKSVCYDRMKRSIKRINKNVDSDIQQIIYNGIKQNDIDYKDSYELIYENNTEDSTKQTIIEKADDSSISYKYESDSDSIGSLSENSKDDSENNAAESLSTLTLDNYIKNKIYLKKMNYKLNKSQIEAISLVLRNKISIIQGPPGSGKTLTCANIVYNLYKLILEERFEESLQYSKGQNKSLKKKILIVSPSNVAVDNIVKELIKLNVKVLRVYSKNRENIENENDNISLHKLVEQKLDKEKKNNNHNNEMDRYLFYQKEIIKEYDVICSTCVTAGTKFFKDFNFPYVLIDEAVQAVEPLCIIPISYGVKKLILVGDHKQLGPTILSHEAKNRGYNMSLFERLIKIGVQPHILYTQYRMDPMISEFISNRFYNGCLISDNNYSNTIKEKMIEKSKNNNIKNKSKICISPILTNLISLMPTFFYHTPGIENKLSTTYYNINEIDIILSLVKYLLSLNIQQSDIGIITMYDGQRSAITKIFNNNNLNTIDIFNIDGFQGREKNIIIISLVRAQNEHNEEDNINTDNSKNLGFIGNNRRMNVAMSRGKDMLVLVGDCDRLNKSSSNWKKTLEYYHKHNLIVQGNINNLKKYRSKDLDSEIKFDLKNILKEIQ